MRALATAGVVLAAMTMGWAAAGPSGAQTPGADPNNPAPFGAPIDDRHVWMHVVADQLEARGGGGTSLRWDAEAWAGPDAWRVWLKSEGQRTSDGRVEDGELQVFLSKPVSTFWDVQVGARYDLDSRPGRTWAAIGVEGLAPRFVNVAATAYVGAHGHLAGKVRLSYDQLLTNRLVLEPEAELNLYSHDDPARLIGSGVSDLDAGLRLRYEFTRKFAPYVGIGWERKFGRTADLARMSGETASAAKLVVGVRGWF